MCLGGGGTGGESKKKIQKIRGTMRKKVVLNKHLRRQDKQGGQARALETWGSFQGYYLIRKAGGIRSPEHLTRLHASREPTLDSPFLLHHLAIHQRSLPPLESFRLTLAMASDAASQVTVGALRYVVCCRNGIPLYTD